MITFDNVENKFSTFKGYNRILYLGDGSLHIHEPFENILEDGNDDFHNSTMPLIDVTSHTIGCEVTEAEIILDDCIYEFNERFETGRRPQIVEPEEYEESDSTDMVPSEAEFEEEEEIEEEEEEQEREEVDEVEDEFLERDRDLKTSSRRLPSKLIQTGLVTMTMLSTRPSSTRRLQLQLGRAMGWHCLRLHMS